MKFEEMLKAQALRRSHDLLVARPPRRVPAVVGGHIMALGGVVGRLEELAAEQEASHRRSKAATEQRQALLRDLRATHVQPIADAARELVDEVPGMERLLALPRHSVDAERLLCMASAMADAAEPHAARLVACGQPEDFVEQLRAAVLAAREALRERESNRQRRRGATVEVQRELARGRKLVRLIDAALRRAYADDPRFLAEWRQAKRVTKKGVPGREEVPEEVPDEGEVIEVADDATAGEAPGQAA